MVDHTPVKSSSISSVAHDPKKNELHVKFTSGATYVYSGVDAAKHQALMGAKSIGSHLNQHITKKHPTRRSAG